MIKETSDGMAVVDTSHFWIPIEQQQPPIGTKVLLINSAAGVALLGAYQRGDFFTHWSPLPRFKKEVWRGGAA